MTRQTLLRFAAVWAIWLTVALVTSGQAYVAGLTAGTPLAWRTAFGNGIVWYSAWAVLTPAVVAAARRFASEQRLAVLAAIHLAAGLCIAVLHAALYASLNAMIYGRKPWAPWSTDLLLLKLTSSIHVHLMIYAIIVGIVLGARAYRELRDREVAAALLQTRLAEAETAALRAQLQPHFLFNTLNAISALVPDDPVAAQRLIARLGDLLRLSIDDRRAQQSTLIDELAFTDAYLAIEEARLGDRLRIMRRVAPETLPTEVPALLLQPLVENAVRHGIAPRVQGGTLTIEVDLLGDAVRIIVADDGKGVDAVIEGVGLGNSRQRLRQLYGGRQSLEIDTAPDAGFRVTILVPR
ncbi:sensor histidine kinase [Sphingomonas gei]|uniref:Sensor histidine kinase n=1 Tax=Sphingomonas gei TaxID=1395960 RepID=A0A4S1XAR2_9SPHN|nr:histidine kinase [Sphingomonas gei]TGX52875.1 sensor histidine kinase [Sphingomonas gei]